LAIIDTNKTKKPFIVDRDDNTFIGIDMPFRVGQSGEGWGASSQTTLDAVKNDLKNLVSTESGERLYQPNLGVKLRKYLFQPFTENLVDDIKNTVADSVSFWLPFVELTDIKVQMSETQGSDFASLLEISIIFSLKKDLKTLESVQIRIGE
tara:strand:- start:319 stop:771 length:453 start_codon:yes stop_codon:yes gene_type:complete